ncbi:MAG: prepilin-type N-terminal cleavage/methylation domain-containing protein [Candidatus Thiodiazotropha sp. (ex Lucinoma borealis)]|nr:prepilin-type N-terminal cleavage/methylation domain-containing protein [Candidatus Thiodiazotropha sp. (ex Lucinoma borealis)]MCU7866777.1 prepilin-type N-terminal cleavage/methylation domain-containing protein [Candidatus Thiodiazotropha sp. (ex Lucinoma borealis)]
MLGKSNKQGFTLIELLLVLTLVAMLAGLAVPIVSKSIQRAKGATLKEDLFVLRKTINDFYADHAHYPQTLVELVNEGYIRTLPIDPLTERYDTWQLEYTTGDDAEDGIIDVRSGYQGDAPDGTRYSEW